MRLRLYYAAVAAAWLLFVSSFFLPAIQGGTGWESFTALMALPWAMLFDARFIVCLAFPPANFLMLVAPYLLYRDQEWAGFLGVTMLVVAVTPWLLPLDWIGPLEVGFYCWAASFALMALACLAIDGQ